MVLHDVAQPSGESRVIQEGDSVVVYERFDAMKAVVVSTKGQYSNRFGNFAMKVAALTAKLVGKRETKTRAYVKHGWVNFLYAGTRIG